MNWKAIFLLDEYVIWFSNCLTNLYHATSFFRNRITDVIALRGRKELCCF